MKIALINYGIGNVTSIIEAFTKQNAEIFLTNDKFDILNSDGLVIPGVGSFSQGMENLISYGLIDVIKEFVVLERPLLGICLGMQLLFDESEEFGITKGLGLIEGKVIELPTNDIHNEKLPHVSWNEININKTSWENTILSNIKEGSDMYFTHSYVAKPKDNSQILSVTEYSKSQFCSSVRRKNIYGCQFHPEKSGPIGLKIINNFINICQL